MSRLLYQAELHRQDDRAARSRDRTGLSQSPNTESNRRPSPYHGDALPTELLGQATSEDTQPSPGHAKAPPSGHDRRRPPVVDTTRVALATRGKWPRDPTPAAR